MNFGLNFGLHFGARHFTLQNNVCLAHFLLRVSSSTYPLPHFLFHISSSAFPLLHFLFRICFFVFFCVLLPMMVLALIYLPPSEKNMDRSVDQYVDQSVDWNENKGRAIHGSIRGLGGPPRPLTKKRYRKTKTKYCRPLHKGRVTKVERDIN